MASNQHIRAARLSGWLRRNSFAPLTYLLATAVTSAHFTADTSDYADSIVASMRGQYYDFWEFGHVLWRPLGWLLLRSSGTVLDGPSGGDLKAAATLVLAGLSWLAGLVTVLAMAAILRRFSGRLWAVNLTVLAFIVSHGFLNFSQSGPPYVPALSMMTLALWVLLRKGDVQSLSAGDAVLSGTFMGLMICFWLPFIVVVPAVVSAPLILSKPHLKQVRILLGSALTAGLFVVLVYSAVAIGGLGIRSVGGFREWMHQTTGVALLDKNVARSALGFARSFIHLGNDGVLFKRYLVDDPFNPVSMFDLVRLSLWKIALFYLFLASIVLSLVRSDQGRRMLALLGLATISVVGVALYWYGGDIERYLALYPVVFLGFALALSGERPSRVLKAAMLMFVVSATLANVYALSLPVQGWQLEKQTARIADLVPRLTPSSRVFLVSYQDEVYRFSRDFPFDPINRSGKFKADSLVEVGGKDLPRWRQDFALQAQYVWQQGGDVWVTRRVMSTRPKSEWNWVEGDDPRISWSDFRAFFSQMELGESAGGNDGFVRVEPSATTHLAFEQYADK